MYDVTALGEALIDFTQYGVSKEGNRLFEQNPGGAVANVICAVSKLGLKTAFIGKVGEDMHGAFLQQVLMDHGVDTAGVRSTSDAFTTLAFVALKENGERAFSFSRKPGADTCIEPSEIDTEIMSHSRILHIGSLSLTHEPARAATFFAVEQAKKSGAIISYDPNYRASLWENETEASKHMRSVLPYVDIIKISDEELKLVAGTDNVEAASGRLTKAGIEYVIITMGGKGAFIGTANGKAVIPGFPCNVVDTTGAGDAFWGGFLYKLIRGGLKIGNYTIDELASFVRFSNATAACCIGKRGGIPAMPTLDNVSMVLNEKQ